LCVTTCKVAVIVEYERSANSCCVPTWTLCTHRCILVRILIVTSEVFLLTLHFIFLGNGGGLEKLLLEMIVCGRLTREDQVLQFISCTLFHVQQLQQFVVDMVREAVRFLKSHCFVLLMSPISGILIPSQFGRATVKSGLSPRDAQALLPAISRGRESMILYHGNASLHTVFLVTPLCTLCKVGKTNNNVILCLYCSC
jgi:hypothetical protein